MLQDSWSLVLAGGAGRRLSALTGGIPKQYWRPRDGRSLLDETMDRLLPVAGPGRTLTVVDASHRAFVDDLDLAGRSHVVYQPCDRGTAAGVLLGLEAIGRRDVDPIVVLSPADHGVADPGAFRCGLEVARERVRRDPDAIVLMGAEPDHPADDFGYIVPASPAARWSPIPVTAFVEKPARDFAEQLVLAGAVWNTMVLVARLSRLRALFAQQVPDLVQGFAAAGRDVSWSLGETYRDLPRFDFSRDVLTSAPNLTLVVWPQDMGWTDLGTVERMVAWSDATAPSPTVRAARMYEAIRAGLHRQTITAA